MKTQFIVISFAVLSSLLKYSYPGYINQTFSRYMMQVQPCIFAKTKRINNYIRVVTQSVATTCSGLGQFRTGMITL